MSIMIHNIKQGNLSGLQANYMGIRNWKEFRNFGSIKCPQALNIQYFTVKARDWTIIKHTC